MAILPNPLPPRASPLVFFRFPREDAAADYECGHSQNKNHKLELLRHGCSPSPRPPMSHTISGPRIKSCAIAPAAWRYSPRSAVPPRTINLAASRNPRHFANTQLPRGSAWLFLSFVFLNSAQTLALECGLGECGWAAIGLYSVNPRPILCVVPITSA